MLLRYILSQRDVKVINPLFFDKLKEREKLKSSISRLVCINFSELEKLILTLPMVSVYSRLSEFSVAKYVDNAHLGRLTNLLNDTSKNLYNQDIQRSCKRFHQLKYVCQITCNKTHNQVYLEIEAI